MKSFPLLLIVFAAGLQNARCTPVSLSIAPGGAFDVTYQLSTGPSVNSTLQITGDLTGDVEMTDSVITRFRFLGGNVAYSDTTNEIIVSTFPVTSKVRLLTRNIISSAISNSSAGAIDAATGIISNTGHRLIQNRGTVTTRYLIADNLIQEDIRNLATDPDSNPMVGVTTLTSSTLQNLNYKTLYRIDFNHTRDETRTQPAEVVNGTVNITEEGGFTASGEIWLPGQAFVDWSLARNEQRPTSLADRCDTSGQPLVVLYAFDAPAGQWTPPVSFDTDEGKIRIQLPEAGLKAPVKLEFNSSLSNTGWMPITKEDLSPSVFNIGESGPVTMDLPSGGHGFIRLALAD
jgi:hypothetical protein